MGQSRDSGEQEAQAPVDDGSAAAAQQQSMFGDMMNAQAQRRQQQMAMRQARVGSFLNMPGLFGMQGQVQAQNPAFFGRQQEMAGLLKMLQGTNYGQQQNQGMGQYQSQAGDGA